MEKVIKQSEDILFEDEKYQEYPELIATALSNSGRPLSSSSKLTLAAVRIYDTSYTNIALLPFSLVDQPKKLKEFNSLKGEILESIRDSKKFESLIESVKNQEWKQLLSGIRNDELAKRELEKALLQKKRYSANPDDDKIVQHYYENFQKEVPLPVRGFILDLGESINDFATLQSFVTGIQDHTDQSLENQLGKLQIQSWNSLSPKDKTLAKKILPKVLAEAFAKTNPFNKFEFWDSYAKVLRDPQEKKKLVQQLNETRSRSKGGDGKFTAKYIAEFDKFLAQLNESE